jgi:hypothetical protein
MPIPTYNFTAIKDYLANRSQDLKDIARELNGMEYKTPIPKDILAECKAKNIIIVSGWSDDLAEFEGAIRDEVGCFGGRVICQVPYIEALWCKHPRTTWTYKIDLPKTEYETFLIRDGEDDYFCEGLVFYKPANFKLCS